MKSCGLLSEFVSACIYLPLYFLKEDIISTHHRIALIDESIDDNRIDRRRYVVSAVVLEGDLEQLNESFRENFPFASRYKSRAMNHKQVVRNQTRRLIDYSREFATGIYVVHTRLSSGLDESARQTCLRSLFIELQLHGVSRAVLDRRDNPSSLKCPGASSDAKTFTKLRRDFLLDRGVVIEHFTDQQYPLLVLADAFAGLGRRHLQNQSTFGLWDAIRNDVQLIEAY